MRSYALGLAALLAATGCGSDGGAPQPVAISTDASTPGATSAAGTDDLALRVGTVDEPLRVAVVGDSIAITLVDSVRAAVSLLESDLGPTSVIPAAALGFGLGADHPARYQGREIDAHHPDWMDRWRDFIEVADPDVVVVMLGTWDAVDRFVDGSWLSAGTPSWSEWYTERVHRAVDLLGAAGARIVWLTEPCLGNDYEPEVANAAISRAVADEPEVVMIDFAAIMCDGGRPLESLVGPDGRPVPVREPDGAHFASGADAVIGPALAELVADGLEL